MARFVTTACKACCSRSAEHWLTRAAPTAGKQQSREIAPKRARRSCHKETGRHYGPPRIPSKRYFRIASQVRQGRAKTAGKVIALTVRLVCVAGLLGQGRGAQKRVLTTSFRRRANTGVQQGQPVTGLQHSSAAPPWLQLPACPKGKGARQQAGEPRERKA